MRSFKILQFCVISFLLLALNNSFALESSILYQANPGDKYSLQIFDEKVQYQNGQKIREIKGKTDVDVKIMKIIDNKYDVVWEYRETAIISIFPQNDPVTPLLNEINKGLKINFVLNKEGNIERIINVKEIKSFMNNALDKIYKSLEGQGAPKDYIEKIKQQLSPVLTNEDNYPQTILKDILLYYHGYGKNFKSNIIEYDTQLPNPLSGAPIPAKGSYQFKKNSTGNNVIEWDQQIDPDSATRFVKEFIKQLDTNADMSQLPPFNINDKAKYEFDKTNAIILMEHERTAETFGKKKIDKKIIKRKGIITGS